MQDISANQKPNAVETEKAILGLSIIHDDLVNILMERLKEEDFYDPKNKFIFQVIYELNEEGKPIDILNISDGLEKNNRLETIGGMDYLYSLINPGYYKSNIESYIDIVKEKAGLRRLIEFSHETMQRAYQAEDNTSDIVGTASEILMNINEDKSDEGLVRISETMQEAFDYMNKMASNKNDITGITTGFRELDRQLSGFQRSDLILLAARPSMGKTALGINMALNAAKKGESVAVFSLEMSKRQIFQRILSMVTMIDLQKIIAGDLNSEEWAVIIAKVEEINKLNIYIDDTSSISLTELRAKSRRMKQEHGLDMIVIDYLQLMTVDSNRIENRQQEISTISRGLKGLAKDLEIPVLSLSQLSRKSEERSDKRPMLSDLRESGAIEQDADVVMMLYRDDYYDEDSESQNITEVIINKHRNGPTGTVKLYFSKEHTCFHDLEYGDPYAD